MVDEAKEKLACVQFMTIWLADVEKVIGSGVGATDETFAVMSEVLKPPKPSVIV